MLSVNINSDNNLTSNATLSHKTTVTVHFCTLAATIMPPPFDRVDMSEDRLKTRSDGKIFYINPATAMHYGQYACDADVVLVMTIPKNWYSEQPVGFGCPHRKPEITLLLSMVSLLHSESPRTILETLVSEQWWNISKTAPNSSRQAVQYNSVMGWRFWFPMSAMTASRISASILATITENTSGKVDLTLLHVGEYDISPKRATLSLKQFHSISTILHGRMKIDIPSVEEMTFEVPNTVEGRTSTFAFTGMSTVFASDPADDFSDVDDEEPPQASSEEPVQTNDPVTHALPETHGLFPFLASVQSRTRIEDQRHKVWEMSAWQHMKCYIKPGRYDPPPQSKEFLHDISSLEHENLLTMCYPPAAPNAVAVGKTLGQATSLVGAGEFGCDWIEEPELNMNEVSMSMFNQSFVRVPVERPAMSLTVTPFDTVFSKKFSGMWTRRLANQKLVPYYLKHFSFETFLKKRFLSDVQMMEATATTSGWPAYTNKLAAELRALEEQMEELNENSSLSLRTRGSFEERMFRNSWADFSSSFVSRNANMFMRDMNLTATQAMIVEYCLSAFGRLPDLFTVAQVVVIVLLGDFGQGKTWCVETVQVLMPQNSQGTGSWVTETTNAHLSEDVLASFTTSDEVHKDHSDLMQNTAIVTRLSGRRRLVRDKTTNRFVEDLVEVLMDRALILAGNDAPSAAIMDRAQPVFIGAHPGRRSAKQCAMAPGNQARKLHVSSTMRILFCHVYRFWHADNLGAIKMDNTIIRVVMAVYEAVMPREYNAHSTRQFVAIRNLAMSLMKIRVTALWHEVVKHRETDKSDVTMYQFFAARNFPTAIDGIRALRATFKLCDSTKMSDDISNQLQALIKFYQNRPVLAENNSLYYETELHQDRMAEQLMALLPVGYGKSIVRWYLNSLTEKAGDGSNAVLVIGNNCVRILKSYVLAAESQAVKAVWETLLWIVANKHQSFWGIDYNTESTLVFSNSTKHLLLKPESSVDFPDLPPPLANITQQACLRALHLLAEAGHVWWMDDHRKIFFKSSAEIEEATTSVFCADIVQGKDSVDGNPIIDGGGIERMFGSDDLRKKRTRLIGSGLVVNLQSFEKKRDADPVGTSQDAGWQKVIENVCTICGGVAPGRYAWGISNDSASQFTETTIRGIDYGPILLDNPNQDLDASGTLTAPYRTEGSCPMEQIFASMYKTVRMDRTWNVTDIVQDYVAKTNTNVECPFKWSVYVTDNKAYKLTASFSGELHLVLVPMHGDFTLEYVIKKQIDQIPDAFDVIGTVGGHATMLAIEDIREKRLDCSDVTIAVKPRTGSKRARHH